MALLYHRIFAVSVLTLHCRQALLQVARGQSVSVSCGRRRFAFLNLLMQPLSGCRRLQGVPTGLIGDKPNGQNPEIQWLPRGPFALFHAGCTLCPVLPPHCLQDQSLAVGHYSVPCGAGQGGGGTSLGLNVLLQKCRGQIFCTANGQAPHRLGHSGYHPHCLSVLGFVSCPLTRISSPEEVGNAAHWVVVSMWGRGPASLHKPVRDSTGPGHHLPQPDLPLQQNLFTVHPLGQSPTWCPFPVFKSPQKCQSPKS